ncbi:MAG: hypothetical protein WCS82_01125 [Candidatus Riflebacteria bacterium]
MNKKLSVFITVFFVCVCAVSYASNTPLTYENARSLAMGGVSVSLADDEQALFCNPAGLYLRESNGYSLINPFMAENKDFDSVLGAIDGLSNEDTAASRGENMRKLRAVMGKTGYRNRSNMAYYIGKTGFGTAAYYSDRETYSVENPVNPRLNSRVDKDMVFSASIARSLSEEHMLFKDKTSAWWGATMKIATRKRADSSYFIRDFSALTPELVKDTDSSGTTMDFDVGGLWQLNNPFNPTIGFFVGNILGSKFSSDAGKLERQFAIGGSIRPLTGDAERNKRIVLAAEYWDNGKEGNFFTKVRLGSEIKIANSLSLHAGVRSGYPTGGLSFAWHDVRLQAAVYSEELGKRPGDFEDKRYAFGATLEF